jgi:acetyltransferase-like isoleucine patch superfamily enzyme
MLVLYGNNMYIVGANTLGEIAFYLCERAGIEVHGFIDDVKLSGEFCDKPIVSGTHNINFNDLNLKSGIFIAIGDNANREIVSKMINSYNIPLINLIDPKATLEKNIVIGVGNLIMAGVYIGAKSSIGNGNLFFPNVSITHHNKIGNFNFFSPNSSVGGYTVIEDLCRISMNSCVRPYQKIVSKTSSEPCSIIQGDSI